MGWPNMQPVVTSWVPATSLKSDTRRLRRTVNPGLHPVWYIKVVVFVIAFVKQFWLLARSVAKSWIMDKHRDTDIE
jgi:hypothetical protein